MAEPGRTPAADAEEIERLNVFKTGYNELIDRQNSLTQTAQQLLSSSILSGDDRNKLADKRQGIDQALKELQKLGRELSTDLNPGNLEKTAVRGFHNLFSGDVTDHRLSYVRFLQTHALLKGYYLQATRAWQFLTDAFKEAGISENSEIRRQLFSTCVRPASDTNDSLRVFVDRMARLLNLQTSGGGVYSPEINYLLSAVFYRESERMAAGHLRTGRRERPYRSGAAWRGEAAGIPGESRPDRPRSLQASAGKLATGRRRKRRLQSNSALLFPVRPPRSGSGTRKNSPT